MCQGLRTGHISKPRNISVHPTRWPTSARSHAERVITADPDAWYGLDAEKRVALGPENFDYVAEAIRRPDTSRAMLEDYRAGLSADLEHDRAARDHGRTIGVSDSDRLVPPR